MSRHRDVTEAIAPYAWLRESKQSCRSERSSSGGNSWPSGGGGHLRASRGRSPADDVIVRGVLGFRRDPKKAWRGWRLRAAALRGGSAAHGVAGYFHDCVA